MKKDVEQLRKIIRGDTGKKSPPAPAAGVEWRKTFEGCPMNAIRIHKKLDSETLNLPELRPLLGQTVEIIVLGEDSLPGIRPGAGDWTAFDRLAREITDYDFDAQRQQDQIDLRHASDYLP
jgi:hypothetical protein